IIRVVTTCCIVCYALWYFFFQAEDGIRDKLVTGVQTCALPISAGSAPPPRSGRSRPRGPWERLPIPCFLPAGCHRTRSGCHTGRSEERRVGKECRCRGCTY